MVSIGSHKVEMARTIIDDSARDIYNGFEALSLIHRATSALVKHNNKSLDLQLTSPDVLRTYVLALMVEAGEFIQTLDWKPWRKNEGLGDLEKTADEFADIVAFVGMIMLILNDMGLDSRELAKAYMRKEHVNVARFEQVMRESHDKLS